MAENVTRVDRGDYTFAECEEYLIIDTANTRIKNEKEPQTPEKCQPPKGTPSPTHAAAPPKQTGKKSSRKRIAREDGSDSECSRKKCSRTLDAHQQVNYSFSLPILCTTAKLRLYY